MKIIYVKWIDTKTQPGWLSKDEQNDCCPCVAETIGWFISEDKKSISLAQSVVKDLDVVGEMIMIPKVAILKKRVLK